MYIITWLPKSGLLGGKSKFLETFSQEHPPQIVGKGRDVFFIKKQKTTEVTECNSNDDLKFPKNWFKITTVGNPA